MHGAQRPEALDFLGVELQSSHVVLGLKPGSSGRAADAVPPELPLQCLNVFYKVLS